MIDIGKALDILRRDTIERGMLELAIVYGWSQIKLWQETLNRKRKN
jgi:hypothetical protein